MLFLTRGVIDINHKHEPVQSGLRQWICPLLLNRILRSQYKERLIQLVRPPRYRHFTFLHRLQQCRLRLRRRPVYLVRQNHIRKDRPFHKLILSLLRLSVHLDNIRARYIRRHKVRRKLNPIKLQLQSLRHRMHHQRLRKPGHALNDTVPRRQHTAEHRINNVILANDNFVYLLLQVTVALVQTGHQSALINGPGCVRVLKFLTAYLFHIHIPTF